MIRVDVERTNDSITRIQIKGHAFTGDPGFDLVCASVSSIATGALNGLDQLTQGCSLYLDESPRIEIICKEANKENQLLMEFLLVQLKTVEEVHKNALRIKEEIQ